jgi:hypothetical protein
VVSTSLGFSSFSAPMPFFTESRIASP